MFEVIKSLPGIKGVVQREHAKMLVRLLAVPFISGALHGSILC